VKTMKPCGAANIRRIAVHGHDLHQPPGHAAAIAQAPATALRQFAPPPNMRC